MAVHPTSSKKVVVWVDTCTRYDKAPQQALLECDKGGNCRNCDFFKVINKRC